MLHHPGPGCNVVRGVRSRAYDITGPKKEHNVSVLGISRMPPGGNGTRCRLCAAFNKTASYTTSRRGGAGGPAGHANILCSGRVASVPSDSICSLSGWQSAPEASGFMIECVTNFSDPGSSGSTAMQRWKALALPWEFVFI